MKFAIPFFRAFQYLDDEQVQFNINYAPKLEKLSNFIEIYGNHRINLIFNNLDDLDSDLNIISVLKEQYPDSNLVMVLPPYGLKQDLEKIKEKSIPFYFNKTVTNIDEFNEFLNLGATDLRIGGWLGFFVEILSKKAKEKGCLLRAYPDICQGSEEESFKNFFIRPEDIDLYAKFIDVFEFAHDKSTLNTVYEVYAKNKLWYGKLNEIILGFKGEEDSRFILPTFAEIRCHCKKRCAYDLNNTCNICGRISELGESLENRGFIIEKGE